MYSREVLLGILCWSAQCRQPLIPGAAQQLTDVVDVRVDGLVGGVAVKGNKHPLANDTLDLHVRHNQHDPVEEEGLTLRVWGVREELKSRVLKQVMEECVSM